MELGIVARRFAHTALDVTHIGHLRTEMKVHQLQALEQAGTAQLLDRAEHLRGRQTEFGLITAGVLPLTGADGGQAHTHP